MPRLPLILLLAFPACTLRCGDNTFPVRDAGSDAAAIFDGGPNSDAPPPLTLVDFAVGGCDELDENGCRGEGPLALTFAAITSSPVQVYLWQFGDGATSTEPSPSHTYTSPGSYTVSLNVEGPAGGLGETKPDWITALPGGLGRGCRDDSDCASNRCVCEADDDCAPPLGERGICAADCALNPCVEGSCIDLGVGAPTQPADWQRPLCLPSCEGGCPSGLVCRDLQDDQGAWVQACFAPGLIADIGEPCIDASGTLEDSRCSSGQCLAVGARGLCGSDCATDPCPSGTSCATFAGALGAQCVRECAGSFDCSLDPWLSCEQPGNPGPLGFSVVDTPGPRGYCAPTFCGDNPSDCDPDGVCVADYCEAP